MFPWGFALLFTALAFFGYFVFASFAFGAGYQPTPSKSVAKMLEFVDPMPGDRLFDLGAGTGAILFRAAERHGAFVVGVEMEPTRVLFLRLRRWFSPARARIEIRWGDLFKQDLRTAEVVTLFLWPSAMTRLRPILEASLPNGARIASHWHPMPGWKPSAMDDAQKVFLYRWPECRESPAPT